MSAPSPNTPLQGFKALRRLVPKLEEAEFCSLCRKALASQHDHLVDPRSRRLLCSCHACALLFGGSPGQPYKRISRTVRYLPDVEITDAEWDALMIPIGIAFFVRQTGGDAPRMTAFYPSPAGPVESLLSLDAWGEIVSRHPRVDGIASDIEALMVNRASRDCFVLPIDECYRLAGSIRANWKGLSGGAEVSREIQNFFEEMKRRAQGNWHA